MTSKIVALVDALGNVVRFVLLPGQRHDIKSVDDYRPIYRKADTWLPAMRVICQRHGVDKTLA